MIGSVDGRHAVCGVYNQPESNQGLKADNFLLIQMIHDARLKRPLKIVRWKKSGGAARISCVRAVLGF